MVQKDAVRMMKVLKAGRKCGKCRNTENPRCIQDSPPFTTGKQWEFWANRRRFFSQNYGPQRQIPLLGWHLFVLSSYHRHHLSLLFHSVHSPSSLFLRERDSTSPSLPAGTQPLSAPLQDTPLRPASGMRADSTEIKSLPSVCPITPHLPRCHLELRHRPEEVPSPVFFRPSPRATAVQGIMLIYCHADDFKDAMRMKSLKRPAEERSAGNNDERHPPALPSALRIRAVVRVEVPVRERRGADGGRGRGSAVIQGAGLFNTGLMGGFPPVISLLRIACINFWFKRLDFGNGKRESLVARTRRANEASRSKSRYTKRRLISGSWNLIWPREVAVSATDGHWNDVGINAVIKAILSAAKLLRISFSSVDVRS
ncbi:hypothetical protein B0H14DRAFT_2613763 [Mycena olivaceomarginata]|nr:hypothetical protein B0H14DRAFT_2613763 [Mycena olivaceomarginata]